MLQLEVRDLHMTGKCSTMEPYSQPLVMRPWLKDMMMTSIDKVESYPDRLVWTNPLDASDAKNYRKLLIAYY